MNEGEEKLDKLKEQLKGMDWIELSQWIEDNCERYAIVEGYDKSNDALWWQAYVGEKDGVTVVAIIDLRAGKQVAYVTTEEFKSVLSNHFQSDKFVVVTRELVEPR